MIPTSIKTDPTIQSSQTRSVNPVTPVTAILELKNSLLEFELGQRYQALVSAQLANGNTKVLIDGKPLQIQLPENFQSGDQLDLILVSREPNLKFLIQNDVLLTAGKNEVPINTERSPGTMAQEAVKSSVTIQPVNGTSLLFTDTAVNDEKNNVLLSATGRFLGTLVQEIIKPSAATHQPVTSTIPVLASPPLNSTELPGLLQKAITQSGLFYESHQAQWINGKNTLDKLHQEPQGRLMPATAMGVSPDSGISVNSQSIPLVQQQLATLETGHLIWRGEIWQGQPMEWDIYEQVPGDEENTDEPATQWRTQLRLSLPQLGDITATILLNTQGVSIELNTITTETGALLKNNQLPLTIGMQSAGLTIHSVAIQQDADT